MARPIKEQKTTSIPLRLPDIWIKHLKIAAENIGVTSYSEVIRMAIKKYLTEELEDFGLGLMINEGIKSESIDTEDFINRLKEDIKTESN